MRAARDERARASERASDRDRERLRTLATREACVSWYESSRRLKLSAMGLRSLLVNLTPSLRVSTTVNEPDLLRRIFSSLRVILQGEGGRWRGTGTGREGGRWRDGWIEGRRERDRSSACVRSF
eukprot:2260059-Rhodomonas_salina.1